MLLSAVPSAAVSVLQLVPVTAELTVGLVVSIVKSKLLPVNVLVFLAASVAVIVHVNAVLSTTL